MTIKYATSSKDPVGAAGSAFDHPSSGRLCRTKGHQYVREVIGPNGQWVVERSDSCFRCGLMLPSDAIN